jgi:hypothetical protein
MYICRLQYMERSPCFLLPLADSSLLPLSIPLYLLGTLLAVIGSVQPGPRLLVNWSPRFHPSPFQNPDPLGFSRAKCAPTKTTSQHWLASPEQSGFGHIIRNKNARISTCSGNLSQLSQVQYTLVACNWFTGSMWTVPLLLLQSLAKMV